MPGRSSRGARPAVGCAELLKTRVCWLAPLSCLFGKEGWLGEQGHAELAAVARQPPLRAAPSGRPARRPTRGRALRRHGGDGCPPRAFSPGTANRPVAPPRMVWRRTAPGRHCGRFTGGDRPLRAPQRVAPPPILQHQAGVCPGEERRRPAVAAAAAAAAVATRDRRGKPARRWAVSSPLVCDARGSGARAAERVVTVPPPGRFAGALDPLRLGRRTFLLKKCLCGAAQVW